MILLLASALLALAPSQQAPCLDDTSQSFDDAKPLERSGPGLWIGGIRFEPRDIETAVPEQSAYTDEWGIQLTFTASGKDKFGDAQRCGVGYPIEISFDGAVISRPFLREKIEGDKVQIDGGFTRESATSLATKLAPSG